MVLLGTGADDRTPPRRVELSFRLSILAAALRLVVLGYYALSSVATGHHQDGQEIALRIVVGLVFALFFTGLTVMFSLRMRGGSRPARLILLIVAVFSFVISSGPLWWLTIIPAVLSLTAAVLSFTRPARVFFAH